MSTIKTYSHHCSQCNDDTAQAPVHPLSVRIAIRTGKIIIFFISGGMLYPHIFGSDGNEIAVECTKCGTRGMISCG